MKKSLLIFSLMAFLVAGCALPIRPTEPVAILTKKPFDKTWAEVVRIVTINGDLPLKVIEKDSGVISTDWISYSRPAKDFSETMFVVSASSHSFAPELKVRYKVSFHIQSVNSETKILIREHSEKWSGTGWIPTSDRPQFMEELLKELSSI